MDIGISDADLTWREAELRRISVDKTLIALSQAEVAALDRTLAERWGIDFHGRDATLWQLLRHAGDQAAVSRLRRIYDRTADGVVLENSCFYNAIAHPELLGPVTSKRRHIILDVTALSVGLYRRLGLSGDVLDAGCHAGIVSSLAAEALECAVTGIDPAEEAIARGLAHSARHPRVTLECASMPWATNHRFAMVVSASAMPWSPTVSLAFLKSLGALLEPGGVAIVVSRGWAEAEPDRVRRQIRMAGLGFGYADVTGGYGDLLPKFEAEGVVVLLKDGSGEYPRRIKSDLESEWPLFRDYANSPGTPDREKTQAFERALRRDAGNHPTIAKRRPIGDLVAQNSTSRETLAEASS